MKYKGKMGIRVFTLPTHCQMGIYFQYIPSQINGYEFGYGYETMGLVPGNPWPLYGGGSPNDVVAHVFFLLGGIVEVPFPHDPSVDSDFIVKSHDVIPFWATTIL
jgi:hypothetical protein